MNNCKINKIEHGNKKLVPNRVSKKCDTDFDSLFEDSLTHHNVLMTNLESVFCRVNGRTLSSGGCLCRNCFYICSSKEIYDQHIVSCFNNEPALIQMPKPEKNSMKITNIAVRWFAAGNINFDLKSLIRPISDCLPYDEKTTTI